MHQPYQGRIKSGTTAMLQNRTLFLLQSGRIIRKNNYLVGQIPYTVKIINNIKRLAD